MPCGRIHHSVRATESSSTYKYILTWMQKADEKSGCVRIVQKSKTSQECLKAMLTHSKKISKALVAARKDW